MKRIIKENNNEIMARCNDPIELGEESLSVDEMQWMRNHQDEFFYGLGLLDTNERANYVPRLFVLGVDENGESKVFDLSQVDIQAGSDEFWKQVQRGNVFAYPAGQNDPVQLQVGVSESGGLKLGTSKPVTEENLPEPPVYKLSMWQKFASWFGFYKKEVHMAEHREEEQNSLKSKLALMQDLRSHTKKEQKDKEAEDVREGERILAERKKLEQLEALRPEKDRLKLGMKVMTDVFVPQPRFSPDLEKIPSGPNKREGLYTKEHFNSLKVYDKKDIDLETIHIGDSGQAVSEEEFASVTMYALWNPKNSMRGYNQMNPDIHGEKSLTELGFEKKDIPTLLTSRSRGWWSTDLFIQPKPRDNEGSYFKDVTNYGRKDAVEAFQAYKAGDKTKLAQIIADGVNMAADDMKVTGRKLTDQNNAVIVTSGKLVDLMEKDPELKTLALEQGMKKDHLKVVEGNRVLHKISQDALDAEYEIKKAKLEGRELGTEEKTKYAKAMVKKDLAVRRLYADNDKEAPEAEEKIAIIATSAKPVNMMDSNKWKKNPNKRPSPGAGKIWMDTMQHCNGSIHKVYRPLPESLGQLSAQKGQEALDKIAEQVVKQENMAQKPTEWLANEIDNPTIDMTKSMADAIQKVANPNAPVKNEQAQPAVQKENEVAPKKTVKDMANMFEPKKNEGPQSPIA